MPINSVANRSLALLLTAAALSARASAQHETLRQYPQAPFLDSSTRTPRLALTLSGGVSLGTYQAGATWALIFALRHTEDFVAARERTPRFLRDSTSPPNAYRLDVITGASAGNMNGVFAAIDYCKSRMSSNPKSSFFYRAWIPIGFAEMARLPVADSNVALFSRESFRGLWRSIDSAIAVRDYPHCELLVGIA